MDAVGLGGIVELDGAEEVAGIFCSETNFINWPISQAPSSRE